MFIALSGPASTGKTTLINKLMEHEDKLKDILGVKKVVSVSETARKIFDEEFKETYVTFENLVNDDLDIMRFQNMVAKDQIEKFHQEYMYNNDTLYLLDRGPLDTMIYTSLNYHHLKSNVVKNLVRDIYEDTMVRLLDTYRKSNDSGYYFCTVGSSDVIDDGFRPLSYINRRNAELVAFDMIRGQMCTLPEGLDSRVDYILKHLII